MPTGARDPRMRSAKRRRMLIAARKIAEAGRTACWICGGLIDPKLPRGHPQAFTLDEVIPRSRGGNPLDTSNVRPAHLSCNSRRGGKLSARMSRPQESAKPEPKRETELW